MAVTTAAGTSISIGTTSATASSDTYKLIGEVTNVSEFGREYQEITHQPMNSRETQKFKGSYNSGSVTLQLGADLEDDGQAALVAALDSDSKYNFKITYPTGDIRYFKAAVMSYKENPQNTNSIIGASVTLSISGDITRVAPTP